MHSKCLFLVRKVCHTNYCGMVSSVQVEMYHTQLEIQALLLLMELHYLTEEATQAAHWCSHQFRAACTGYTANTMSADALWTLEVGHQQSCYWSPKPDYFFSSIKRVKITTSSSRGQWVNAIWPVRLWEFSISRYYLTSRGIPIIKINSTV